MDRTRKTRILAAFLLCLSFCSCGTMREETGADISSEATSYQMIRNEWIDTSDLTYVGKVEQRIAIGYDFDNPEDQNPVVYYDKYVSPEGETFHFDAEGQLRLYRNCDDVFDQNSTLSTSQKAALTETEKHGIMEKIYADLTSDDASCTIEQMNGGAYQLTGDGARDAATAQIEMTRSGEIRSVTIGHRLQENAEEAAYFEAKLQEKIDSVKSRHDVISYETTVRFERTDEKTYGLYTVVYICSVDGSTVDPYNICEGYGFAKPMHQEAVK